MKRGRKKKIEEEIVIKEPEKISFDRALSLYRKQFPHKAYLMEDKEVVKIVMEKQVPSLMTTKEEWNKLFSKF